MTETGTTSPDVAPIEVAPGIYRLGGVVPLDDRLSWVAAQQLASWEPVSAYLVLDSGEALLVDTGVTVHRALIFKQLRELLGTRRLSVALTRFEPDCLVNLSALRAAFPVDRVYGGGVSNPFDFFEDVFDEANNEAQVRAGTHVEMVRKRPGDSIVVGGRSLALLATSLRLLTTFWIHDSSTGTLFTSDSFGYRGVVRPTEPPIIGPDDGPIDQELVAAHLFRKFEWLRGAETGPIASDLASVVGDLQIERLCPSHGCIIEGTNNVSDHLDVVLELLLSAECGVEEVGHARTIKIGGQSG